MGYRLGIQFENFRVMNIIRSVSAYVLMKRKPICTPKKLIEDLNLVLSSWFWPGKNLKRLATACLAHGGRCHYVSLGVCGTPLNRKVAKDKAFEIERDLEYGKIDTTYSVGH